MFSGDGTYLLGSVSKECPYDDYAEMLRELTLDVLDQLKKRHNWKSGDTVRLVFHAHRPMRRVDVAKILFDCARQVGDEQQIQMAFVTISHDHPFYILDRQEHGIEVKGRDGKRKGELAPKRGTIARIGRFTRLLSVNSGPLIKRPNSPLPTPLLVSLHPDSTFFL